MEAVGLIYAVKKLSLAVDDALTSYRDVHGTLAAIRSQVSALDVSTGQIQGWFDKSSKAGKQQLSPSIDDAVGLVEREAGQLELDLKKIAGAAGSNVHPALDAEAQLRERLGDIREGVSLVNFTLTVCRLRDEQQRLKCAQELQIASSTLRRARQCHLQQQRAAAIAEEENRARNPSPDFKAFMAEVMTTERAREPDEVQVAAGSESQISLERAMPAPLRTNGRSGEAPSSYSELNNTAQQSADSQTGLVHRPASTKSSAKGSINTVGSLVMPNAEEECGSYASRPSHTSPSEGTFPNLHSEVSSSARPIFRKPVPSMASTMVPTSPIQENETIPPEKSSFHNMIAPEPDAGPSSPRAPPPPRASDLKLGPLAEEHPDEAPPAYQEQVRSPPPPALPPRPQPVSEHANVNHTDDTGRPYLIKVVQENLTPVLQVLIERGVDLEAADAQTRRRAIMEAARLGREEMTNMLLNGGCQLDWVDVEGNTVLHHAVIGGFPQIVQQIISTEKIDVNTRGPGGRTPLHIAMEFGNSKMVSTLIRGRADYSLKDESQRTPLHIGAARGNLQMCEILLEEGADIDTYDRDGKTPLQIAARGDRSAVVELLLSRTGASKPNYPELTKAFFEAVKIGNVRMAQSILAKDLKLKKLREAWKPAAFAAQSGNLDMLRLVIDNKASLKEKSPEGWTPLHFAASMGYSGMVQRLLDEKVSPKTTTKVWGETALHMAVSNGHASTAELLIANKNTDHQATDLDQNQPLHHAARLGLSSVAQALLAKGVKANNENKYGWRPIHLAAAYGHVALAADLIGNGVSIEEKLCGPSYKPSKHTHEAIRRGYTAEARWPHPAGRPLSLALEFGQDGFARMLLAHGAKIDGIDVNGWRPLHQASFACNPEMVETLLQRGANPHNTTNDNNTPLALGFRSAGLNVTQAQKEHVRGLLQDAMFNIKPLKFDALRRGVSFGGNSASQRNLAWNTAEMASALLVRQGSTALGEGESMATSDTRSGSGVTPSTDTGEDSEDLSMSSSAPDLQRRMSPLQAGSKQPSFPAKSPTGSGSRENTLSSPHQRVRPEAVELSSQPSIHRRMAELDGPEIVERGGSLRSAELGTRMPTLEPSSEGIVELPAEKM
jgi:ankyrin repeat protein